MNCECVFVLDENRDNPEKLVKIAHALLEITDEIELHPFSVAAITTETKAYNTYDEAFGWQPKGRCTRLNPGDLVLFVGGKYHYMSKRALARYLPKAALTGVKIVFPSTDQEFFEDIIFYE